MEENALNIKENEGEEPLSKIMRLNSILSDKKDKFNYSMMFETPPRKKFPGEDPLEDGIES